MAGGASGKVFKIKRCLLLQDSEINSIRVSRGVAEQHGCVRERQRTPLDGILQRWQEGGWVAPDVKSLGLGHAFGRYPRWSNNLLRV